MITERAEPRAIPPTIAVEPDGDQTRLTYTEQGVHFDGLDTVEGREEGSRALLDQLGSYLTPAPA